MILLRWSFDMAPSTQVSMKVYICVFVCVILQHLPQNTVSFKGPFRPVLGFNHWTLPLTNFKEKVLCYTKVSYFKVFLKEIISINAFFLIYHLQKINMWFTFCVKLRGRYLQLCIANKYKVKLHNFSQFLIL